MVLMRNSCYIYLLVYFWLIVRQINLKILDIHFQYNGFLKGLLILTCDAFEKAEFIKGAIIFGLLLCFKHIYLYTAPVFGIVILKSYCFQRKTLILSRLMKLVAICFGLLVIVFLPFLSIGKLYTPYIMKNNWNKFWADCSLFKEG